MTGISIDGIAVALPTGPTPSAGAGNGRFAGLIADLSARMKAGAPVADAPLPDGLTLPVDRQDLAGDDAAATPQDMADDDETDAVPMILTAFIPAPVSAPGIALAPRWKMPVQTTDAPRILTLPETAAASPQPTEPVTPIATPVDAAAADAPAITPPADPAAAPVKATPANPAIAAAPRPDAPARADGVSIAPHTPAQSGGVIATATATATGIAAPAIAQPDDAPVPTASGTPTGHVQHHGAETVVARAAPIPAPAPMQAAQAAPAIIANAGIHAAPVEDQPAVPDSAVEPVSASGLAPVVSTPAPAVHRAAAPATTQPAVDTGRAEWIEAMVDRIDEMRGHGGHRETRIRLLPDALGAVDVRIQRDGDRVNVHFTTDNPHARALLNEAAPRLVEMAESRGLKLGDTGVRHDSGQAQSGQAQSGQARSDQSQSDQPRPDRSDPNRRAASRPADANPDATPGDAGERIA